MVTCFQDATCELTSPSVCRESFTTFFVIGLSSRLTRDFDKPVHACLWLPPGHPPGSAAELNTTAVLEFVKCDEHVVPYGVVVVKCQFPVQVGADDLGGNLSLTVSAGPPVGKVRAGTRLAILFKVSRLLETNSSLLNFFAHFVKSFIDRSISKGLTSLLASKSSLILKALASYKF